MNNAILRLQWPNPFPCDEPNQLSSVLTISSVIFVIVATVTDKWRVQYHIVRMGASFIAVATAFSQAGAHRFIGDWEYQWTLWIIPTIIGTSLISYYKSTYFKKAKPTI